MSKCDSCLWSDQCHDWKKGCNDYTPEDEDEIMETAIEEGKYEFRHVFDRYVSEYQ